MRRKLGLQSAEADDAAMIQALLDWMQRVGADFTNTFRDLSLDRPLTGDLYQDADFQGWHARWQQRLGRDGHSKAASHAVMRAANPAVIPRNHRVEEALAAAEERDDLVPFQRLLAVLSAPYEEGTETAAYREPPADESGYRTFCGT